MGILVLVLLVAAWGLVLAPTLLGKLKDPSPMDTEKAFHRTIRAVVRVGARKQRSVQQGGRWVLVPRSSDYPPQLSRDRERDARRLAAERRAHGLTALAGFCLVSFFVGMFVGPLRWMLRVSLLADILLVGYLAASVVVANRTHVRSPHQTTPIQPDPAPTQYLQPPEAAAGGRV